jgi:hypothetical protein
MYTQVIYLYIILYYIIKTHIHILNGIEFIIKKYNNKVLRDVLIEIIVSSIKCN